MLDESQKEYRISNVEIGLMIGVAIVADLVGLIPFVGWIGSIIGGGTIILWMWIDGIPPLSFKEGKVLGKLLNVGANSVGEAVSAGIFPSVLIYTVVALVMVRLEDKTGLNLSSPEKVGASVVKKSIKKTVGNTVTQTSSQNHSAGVDGIRERKAA